MRSTPIPRELVPWFPTVDEELCLGDQECFNFCKNDVFSWDEANQRPIVRNPYNCVVGCQACLAICPSGAIQFPTKEELRESLRALRARVDTADAPGSQPPPTTAT